MQDLTRIVLGFSLWKAKMSINMGSAENLYQTRFGISERNVAHFWGINILNADRISDFKLKVVCA